MAGVVSGEEDDLHLAVDEWWRRFLPDAVALAAKPYTLSTADARAKLDALAAYRTQLPGLNCGQLELLRRAHVISHEVSWTVDVGAG